jgi:hypothetical protein
VLVVVGRSVVVVVNGIVVVVVDIVVKVVVGAGVVVVFVCTGVGGGVDIELITNIIEFTLYV